MPTYRFIDYNELTTKPANVDMFAIYDIDADELKKLSYSTLKSFFVKTNEPTDVEAIVEFQSTSTKPNSILKFGSAGEFIIYSDGTDLFVKGTNAAGKLRLYANSIEMFTLNPVNSSIATQGMAINSDGTAGVGINFDSSNRPVLLTVLQCNAGIAAKLKNISYTGGINTGLVFNSNSDATFKQGLFASDIFEATGASRFYSTLQVDGILDQNAPIMLASKINADGSTTKGLWFAVNGDGTFLQNLYVAGYIRGYDYLQTSDYIRAGTFFNCNGTDGYTGTINTTINPNIICKGGLVVGFS